jgi:hypothetical protein
VSTGGNWHYNRKRLDEALAAWKATGPDEVMKAAVDIALMDLIKDPLGWGKEDPNVPGVFQRSIDTVTGAKIGILYAIPDLDAREIGVADIRIGS